MVDVYVSRRTSRCLNVDTGNNNNDNNNSDNNTTHGGQVGV